MAHVTMWGNVMKSDTEQTLVDILKVLSGLPATKPNEELLATG